MCCRFGFPTALGCRLPHYSERCVCLTPLTPLFTSEYAYAPNDPSAVSQIPGGSVGLQLHLPQDIKETILYSERCVCLTLLTPLFTSEYADAPNDPSAVSQIPGGSVGLQLHLPQDIKETILYSERCVCLTLLTPLFTSEICRRPRRPLCCLSDSRGVSSVTHTPSSRYQRYMYTI